MYFFLIILVVVLYTKNTSNGYHTSDSFIESSHVRYTTPGNPHITLKSDCALRAFTIEMAAYIAPTSLKMNWTTLSQSALQMNQCNSTSYTIHELSSSAKPLKTSPKIKNTACHRTVFVSDSQGDDSFNGTFERPIKTIQVALLLTRTLRTADESDKTLCITIRGGTYYLGTNATTASSQIGGLALISNDSNLVIENYEDERVVLSGGTLLQLQWSVHAKTITGNTILKAQVPSNVNLDHFNELYVDEKRAIVAKYPNGDPATQGLYATNPGFSNESESWLPPIHIPCVYIQVQEPFRNGTAYPNYQLGLGGGASVFHPPHSYFGSHDAPRGFTVKNGALPHISNWSKPTTGFVHAFQGAYWSSWAFKIASVDTKTNTIMFGRGGFQEPRGWKNGGAFYVANIFEELDSPNEWFLDKDTRTLYFMPNGTLPTVFVASQLPCLISLSGSSIENPVHNVMIKGLIFTQTSHTYMRDYMVPSGGGWTLHPGGTIYLSNTKDLTITENLFTELGSNAIALIDYNNATVITLNEFVWLADSGIILVGSTNGIDGFSVKSQPTNILIQLNLFHETGIYMKQSSPVFISVSRSVLVIGNLMFNMPRAGIEINDGFYGNHTLSSNVIFNTVRETNDHGPINTWDRQPFLTDAVQSGLPSLRQHESYIHHNLLVNNYRSVWPIDHDDGSCFYEDSYNFLVYGGKKNYLGHSKIDHHEIYVYADANFGLFHSNVCVDEVASKRNSSGWNETWIENVCILYNSSIPYHIDNCDTDDLFVPYLTNNKIYIPSGTDVSFTCKVNGTMTQLNLQQWQSYGLDINTTVQTTPDVQTIIEWGRKMLQGDNLN